jgi:hypothetical protein
MNLFQKIWNRIFQNKPKNIESNIPGIKFIIKDEVNEAYIEEYEKKLRAERKKGKEKTEKDFLEIKKMHDENLKKLGIPRSNIQMPNAFKKENYLVEEATIENAVKLKKFLPENEPMELSVSEFRKRIKVLLNSEKYEANEELFNKILQSGLSIEEIELKSEKYEKFKNEYEEWKNKMGGRKLKEETALMYKDILIIQNELIQKCGANTQKSSLTNSVRTYSRRNKEHWTEKKIKSISETIRQLLDKGTLTFTE